MKISKETMRSVVKLINAKTPYRKILKLLPEIKSISMLTRIKQEYLAGNDHRTRIISERTKRKISKKARERYLTNRSEIIMEGYLNILKGFELNILNMEAIQKMHAESFPLLMKKMKLLNVNMNRMFAADKDGLFDEDKRMEFHKSAIKTQQKANNILSHSNTRIKAIAELRKQFESYVKLKIDVEVMNEIGKVIQAFVQGCKVLDDAVYLKYKARVILEHEASLGFFEKYEGLEPVTEQNLP